MLSATDALAVLGALNADDPRELFKIIPWEECETMTLVAGVGEVRIGRLGIAVMAYGSTVGFRLHSHPTVEVAVACYATMVTSLRSYMDPSAPIGAMLDQLSQIQDLPTTDTEPRYYV